MILFSCNISCNLSSPPALSYILPDVICSELHFIDGTISGGVVSVVCPAPILRTGES